MRLDEVINWLNGQGWFDLSQPRMSPGANTIIHWSRLVDLPIALVMLPFITTLGLTSAAMIAAWIVPPLLFGLMLGLATLLVRPFVSATKTNLSALMVLFAPMVLFNFAPGRVDHHGYQILIAGFGVYCIGEILTNKQGWRHAIAASFAFACGLWIGTEALPWLLLSLLCIALFGAWKGNFALRNAAVFGAALAVATSIVLFVALPANEFSSRALSWFSCADVLLAFLAAAVLILSWLAGRLTNNKMLRLSVVVSVGLFAALQFVLHVPEIWNGPFADYDNFNSTIALDNISEARPLAHAFWIDRYNPLTWQRALNAFIHSLFLPLLALSVMAYNALRKNNRARMLWLVHGIFLSVTLLLTLFWQVRIGYFMELFSIAPLTWLLSRGWDYCGEHFRNRTRLWAEIGIFLVLGPLPIVLIPGLFDHATLYRDVVLFPAARTESSCLLKPATDFLNQIYHKQNTTIMTGMNEGPEILYRTPYNVVGGNFNVRGNPDVFAFFNARDDAAAQDILHKWHANLVLTCRNMAPFFAGLDHAKFGQTAFLQPQKDGKLHLISSPNQQTLIEKLVNDKVPEWLKVIEIPGSSDYLLFEVQTKNGPK